MYKNTKDKDIIVVLGDLAKRYTQVSLGLVNHQLHSFGLDSITKDKLDTISKKVSEGDELYKKVKSGNLRLEDYFTDNVTPLPKVVSYIDDKGFEHGITLEQLDRFINIKDEYEKAYSGNTAWNKIEKRCALLGIDVENTKSFTDLVKWREFELGKTPSIISHSSVYADDIDKGFEKEIGKLNLKNRDTQNHTRDFNRVKRELTDQYLFRQQLLKAIPATLNIKDLPKIKKVKGGETLVVTVSDIHVGLKTANYNYETLKNRMSYYRSQVADYVSCHKVSNIIIAGLGDLIEGAYMHATQLYELEFGMGEQVSHVLSLILDFVSSVRKLGINTSYVAISGNHDRLNGLSKKDNLLGDSVVDIINAIIESKSKELGIKYIKPATKVRHLLTINGTNIVLVHGDIDKLQDKTIISKLSSFFNKKVDTVIAGHLHSFWLTTLGFNQYLIQTSSSFDGNSYSDKLGVKNTPGQIMLSINQAGIITPHFIVFE